jgi:Putative prokaryotic signal transducing protein
MHDRDSLIVIASHLRPEEAGMLRGLLDSAGIMAVMRDEVLSGVNPFLQPAIGGAKVAVRAADAASALEIIRSAGVLPGPGPEQPVEIPEEEWRAKPDEPSDIADVPSSPTWPRRGLWTAPFLFALILALWRCGVGG